VCWSDECGRDAVWVADSGWPKERSHALDGDQYSARERSVFRIVQPTEKHCESAAVYAAKRDNSVPK